jgi:hypothetical protein
MFTEQEIINNAFKKLQFQENIVAKKYACKSGQINDPKVKQLFNEMEQGARNNHKQLSENMTKLSIT